MVVIPKLYRNAGLPGNVAFEGFNTAANGNIKIGIGAWTCMFAGAARTAEAADTRYAYWQYFKRWFGVGEKRGQGQKGDIHLFYIQKR